MKNQFYTDADIRIKFKKSEELFVSGGISQPWFWRDNELSYKEFSNLEKDEKDKHISFLLSLSDDMLSSNDEAILRIFGPKDKRKQPISNYFSLSDDNVELDAMTRSFLSFNFDEPEQTIIPTEEIKMDDENEINL